jgi:hypothetical protein
MIRTRLARCPDTELAAAMQQSQQVKQPVVITPLSGWNRRGPPGLDILGGARMSCRETGHGVHGHQPGRVVAAARVSFPGKLVPVSVQTVIGNPSADSYRALIICTTLFSASANNRPAHLFPTNRTRKWLETDEVNERGSWAVSSSKKNRELCIRRVARDAKLQDVRLRVWSFD